MSRNDKFHGIHDKTNDSNKVCFDSTFDLFQCIFALMYTLITDLQVMQEYASLSVQAKMLLVLTALFYLRWKYPNAERPVKVGITFIKANKIKEVYLQKCLR